MQRAKKFLTLFLTVALCTGLMIVPARADSPIRSVHDGVVIISPNTFMDVNSVVKSLPEGWTFAGDFFSEGVAIVTRTDENGMYISPKGVVDTSGKLLFQFDCDWIGDFSDGVAVFGKDGKQGLIDKTGTVILQPTLDYSIITRFVNGIAAVEQIINSDSENPTYMFGIIDKTGTLILSRQYDTPWVTILLMNELPAGIKDTDGWNYYDAMGNKVISGDFDKAGYFNEGVAIVEKDGETYIINTSGEKVVSLSAGSTYDNIFWGGLLWAKDTTTGKEYFLDKTGRIVLTLPDWVTWQGCGEGLIQVKINNGNVGFLDKTGKLVLEIKAWSGAGTPRADEALWVSGSSEGYIVYQTWDGGDNYYYHIIRNPLYDTPTPSPSPTPVLPVPSPSPSPEPSPEPPAPVANPFTDMTGHWAYNDILWAYESGLVMGMTATTFEPNTPMTRAMLVTIFYRLAGQPTVTGNSPFGDVSSGEWYSNAVAWAAANGIVTGTSDTAFSPNVNMPREQLVTVLYRYAQLMGYDASATGNLSGFTDAGSISDYAQEAMAWAVGVGLISGYDNGSLNPLGGATRAEIVTVLHRFVDNIA